MHRLLPPSPPVIHSTGTAHLVGREVLEPALSPGGDSRLHTRERCSSLGRLEALMTAVPQDRETKTLVNDRSRYVVRFEDRGRDKGGFMTVSVVLVTGNDGPGTCPAPDQPSLRSCVTQGDAISSSKAGCVSEAIEQFAVVRRPQT